MTTAMRHWQVIKLGEEPHAVHGILIEGPRCEDEMLVAWRDVLAACHEWEHSDPDYVDNDIRSFLSERFGVDG